MDCAGRSNSGDENARFGEQIARLMREIDKHANRFGVPPVGPVGKYITLKEKRWGTAIEAAIGFAEMNAILVNDYKDEQTLQKMMKSMNYRGPRLSIVRKNIEGGSYKDTGELKTEKFPARNKGFLTALDMIDVTHVAVANYLYDIQVYQSLLCKDEATCKRIAFAVPRERNVKDCFDPDGSRYFETGGAMQKITNNTRDNRRVLVADNTQMIEAAVQSNRSLVFLCLKGLSLTPKERVLSRSGMWNARKGTSTMRSSASRWRRSATSATGRSRRTGRNTCGTAKSRP